MSPKSKENTERVSTFLAPEVLGVLKLKAQEKGLSLSALIRMVLMDYAST